MTFKLSTLAATGAALALLTLAGAQEPRQPVEERIGALERAVATLDTRLGLRSAAEPVGSADRDYALTARVDSLQTSIDRLANDIQRVERMADNAMREASEARREAMNAERTARDAMMRR
jgi:uncharacterized protein DUF3359